MVLLIILLIISILADFFAGLSKSFADLSDQGELKGDPKIRHKHISWVNKWKNGTKALGEKFFGSSRWFVALSDTWHRADLGRNILLRISGVGVGILAATESWYFLFGILIGHIIFATSFHIFHTTKILKNEN